MNDKTDKKRLGVYKRATLEAIELAGDRKIVDDDYVLHQYDDYETYKKVQVAGNKAKLRMQFVKESHIKILATYLNEKFPKIEFGLCHGTRRGLEQTWFREHLSGESEVIGTEISDTAAEFPYTVQWDFHEVNEDWSERADFVYSNSWDHAYDPEKCFSAWIDSLKIGGLLLLDHTKGQMPEAANALDPFGISLAGLKKLFAEKFIDRGQIVEVIQTHSINKEYKANVVVFERHA